MARAIHLIDCENLNEMSPRDATTTTFCTTAVAYARAAGAISGDQYLVGVNPQCIFDAAVAFSGARLVTRRGPSGAELAILDALEPTDHLLRRYGRIVIGSGDSIFTDKVYELASAGLAVDIVAASPRSLSRELAAAADSVRFLSQRCSEIRAA